MSEGNVIALFKLCIKTTYFSFNKNLYQQKHGLPIGASSSRFAAELFMEKLEKTAIATFIRPPGLWTHYFDDTFANLKKSHEKASLEHLNKQHPRMKFTTGIEKDRKLAFLETLGFILLDKTVKITIFRKATYTDQYLDFRCNHHQTKGRNNKHFRKNDRGTGNY